VAGRCVGALLPNLLVVLGVLISVFAPDLLSLLPDLSFVARMEPQSGAIRGIPGFRFAASGLRG